MKHITIGILAHVDSGKTTLSESILYKTGVLKKLGRVDYGNSFLDTNSIERDRGITIFASQAQFTHSDIEFTLLDTPGHIDFSPEMERTLKVLDYALLVISGTDGVQTHTETLWRLLASYKIPVFIFVNKMDISMLSHRELMNDLKQRLDENCIDFNASLTDDFAEEVALCSEKLMDSYASGIEFKTDDIRKAIAERQLFPCYFGSALRSDGVNLLLDGLAEYISIPAWRSDFGAKVYRITQDEQGERLTHIKLTGGSLKVKNLLTGSSPDGSEWSEKINQIRLYSGTKFKTLNEIEAGMVCTLTGLTAAYPGEGLGFEKDSGAAYLEPVLNYRVILPSSIDTHTALTLFRQLEDEEPELHIVWNEQLGEIHFRIMGDVQLEVLKRLIFERYGMDIEFSDGGIAYKETIAAPVIGIGHYEPLRHYAEVQLLLEPTARGSGLQFASDCDPEQLGFSWQRLILTHLSEREHIGVLTGSPITDMKITLIAGRASEKHTEGGDFRQAVYRAVRQGLRSARSVLLEPWYDFKIELPTESVGRAMTDITQFGGHFSAPDSNGEYSIITGSAPTASMRGYHRKLVDYTKGRGRLSLSVRGYEKCCNSDEIIAAFGYDPDRDVDNTADSIFCARGAGFAVKWSDVPQYKHIDSGIELDSSDEADIADRVERYIRTVADDAELMRIFERTYGPIKHKTIHEPRVKKSAPTVSKPIKSPTRYSSKSKEYLLIDGYNIIFAWDELNKLAAESLDLARNELITRISNYQGFKQCEIIIVFDAYKVKHGQGELERINNISVVYTKEAETADTYIEKATHELSKTHRVRVATSDNQEQLIILGNGAIRLSASGFHAEVEAVEKEIREFLS
ncbi:MAG: GTP-binding protein [Clostridiales bacterium]|nr:GTP-binding protein [Clostridiales bacterium]